MKKRNLSFAGTALAAALAIASPADSQIVGGFPQIVPLGYCQLTASGTAAELSTATCSSFTGSGSGTTLTASSVSGYIRAGATVVGTGVPTGTTIVQQLTGPPGGAGTYLTSAATTSSTASLTTTGIPQDVTGRPANLVVISVETANIRWRDDGGVPTTSVGMPIVAAAVPMTYVGTLINFQVIAVSGSPVVNAAFYRLP